MSKGFSATETIDRPIGEVWRFMTDWSKTTTWMRGIDAMRPLGEGPVREGTRLAFSARGAERESTIVAWQPPNALTLRSVQGPVTAIYEYRCQGVGGRTVVTLDARCSAEGILWKLAHPMIVFMMKRVDGGQLAALKRCLET
ncbi:MAG: SRPBCC family protein [Gemmatimonadales bacterium]